MFAISNKLHLFAYNIGHCIIYNNSKLLVKCYLLNVYL